MSDSNNNTHQSPEQQTNSIHSHLQQQPQGTPQPPPHPSLFYSPLPLHPSPQQLQLQQQQQQQPLTPMQVMLQQQDFLMAAQQDPRTFQQHGMMPPPPTQPLPLPPTQPLPLPLAAHPMTAFPLPSKAASKKPKKKKKDNKKRPYRRTKRPKNYCDKSTVTTVNPKPEIQQANVYDGVLAECKDLLAAAAEAQQLGRLKMAAAYQLLLHARLVGLGKRFDKAPPVDEEDAMESKSTPADGVGAIKDMKEAVEDAGMETTVETALGEDASVDTNPVGPEAELAPPAKMPEQDGTATVAFVHEPTAAATIGTATSSANTALASPTPPTARAARELAKMLPQVDFDQTMMEHLAKAAAELHAARSGRQRQLDEEAIQSPQEFLAQTTTDSVPTSDAAPITTKTSSTQGGIAWSGQEVQKLQHALNRGQTDPIQIAQLTGRSTQQVKAFLKNQTERARVQAEIELPHEESPRKKSGRGRKPVTTALNTVPNAHLDAKALLQGQGIWDANQKKSPTTKQSKGK